MIGTTTVRLLDCKLTEDEWDQKSSALAEKEIEKARVELEKRLSTKSFNSRINLLAEEIAKLSQAVDTRKEQRDVQCKWERPDDANEKLLYRLDTMDIIERRPLDPGDRQVSMFPEDREPPPEHVVLNEPPPMDGAGPAEPAR